MTITPADMELEDNNLSQTQRITFGYDIAFTSTNAFTQEDVPETIGASVAGLSTVTTIDLTTRQHPYMVHGPTSWLSADTRVFKLRARREVRPADPGHRPEQVHRRRDRQPPLSSGAGERLVRPCWPTSRVPSLSGRRR